MVYLIICTVALVVSALTLFSGFGLGTLLMPAFAVFFPVEVAVGATAVVHLANNIFKLALVGKMADYKVVVKFAVPASILAIIGALLLNYFAGTTPLAEYGFLGKPCTVTILKLVIAFLIAVFAILELHPRFEKLAFNPRYIPLGGALSGFFEAYPACRERYDRHFSSGQALQKRLLWERLLFLLLSLTYRVLLCME